MMTSTKWTNFEKEEDEFFDTPAIFFKILQTKLKKKPQHAMFSNSRRKGKAEDDTDDDINELTNFEKSPKMSKNANSRANLKGI